MPKKPPARTSRPRPKTTPKRRASPRARAAAGRPKKYSAAVHKTIIKALENGNYRSIAFRLAGIHEDTGFEWLKLGRDDPAKHREYAKLARDVIQAEARFEDEMLGVIRQSARRQKPQSWLPAMTVLERTRPQRFARRDTTVLEGGESPIQVLTHAVIADEGTRTLARDLLRRAATPRAELAGGIRVGDEPSESAD